MRRRARFLRRARELAYRDLGGLVFDLHRFGQRNDPVVTAKLTTLQQIDSELRALEQALNERRPVTVLREVGIAACPRCAALHGSDDRFCPGCGLAFDANAERPMSTVPVSSQANTGLARASLGTEPGTKTGAPDPAAKTTADGPGLAAKTTAVEGPNHAQAPGGEPAEAPAVKPTAAPVPARPDPLRRPTPGEEQDEPTQVIRPPARGA